MACFWIPTRLVSETAIHGAALVPLTDALARGPERWDHLVACSPAASPFMRWAWHSAWARAAPAEDVARSFAIVVNGSSNGEDAVIPLSLRTLAFRRAPVRAVTWATGGVGYPDHLDVPAASHADMREAVSILEGISWDVMVLSGVAEDPVNVNRFVEAFAERGYSVRRVVLDSCPYIDLPSTWDEYLAGLSAERRQNVRRRARKLTREHAAHVTDYAPDRLDEGWACLRSLHERRWGGPGAFGAPVLSGLLRGYSEDLAARGEVWLTSLDLAGEPAAAWCGFAWRDTVYFYQTGRDPKWERESVGQVLTAAMIRRAIERGYKRFDFLRGRDSYKMLWTSTMRPVYEVVIFRPGGRGSWLRALDLLGRARARVRSRPEFAVWNA